MEPSELLTYLLTPVVQVGLIIGLAEVAKNLGLPSKYIPIFDVVLGIIFGLSIFTAYSGMAVIEGIVIGLALGLSACGLFSGIKNVSGK